MSAAVSDPDRCRLRRGACALAVIVALAVALGACGADEKGEGGSPRQASEPAPGRSSRGASPVTAALCRPLAVARAGRVEDPAAQELSGLVASRTQPGVLWAHNDSGDTPRLLALARDGRFLGSFEVSGAEALDWEDIAARGGDLYVGDIGDNAGQRPGIVAYLVAEPDAASGGATLPATALRLRYPDGPHDAEALLVDPRRRDLVVVTKEIDGLAGVYVAKPPASGGAAITLRRAARIDLGVGSAVTAGDVSPEGSTVALRSYDRLFVWSRRRGESIVRTLRRPPCSPPTELREPQGEALALERGGRAALTVTEGPAPVLRRYTPRRGAGG